MARKALAVDGCTLSYAAPVTGASASFTSPASLKVKAEGKGVYKDGAGISIPSGVTNGTCTTNTIGTGSFSATATKNKVEGKAPLRVDDEVTVSNIPGVLSGGGTCALTVTVKISNAGQSTVLGE